MQRCAGAARASSSSGRDSGRGGELRPGPHAERESSSAWTSSVAGLVQKRLDERRPNRVLGRPPGPSPSSSARNAARSSARSPRGLAEEHGRPHRGRPRAFVAAEERLEASRSSSARIGTVVEERELPALERLEQIGVRGRLGQPCLERSGEPGAERVEPRRLARGTCAASGGIGRTPYGRQSRRSKSTGPAATAPGCREPKALTARPNSAAASGAWQAVSSRSRSSSRTSVRSTSRPKSGGGGDWPPATRL